jgi:carboxyl-terminal processing protease
VQNLVDLDRFGQNGDGGKPQYGELKMTIAEFFRINGGSTQLKGVTPDIQYPQAGDDKDFGESTYDNALAWTHIAPADYKPVADMQAWLPQLRQMHDARVAASPAWKLMLDELAQYKKMRDRTTVSLNFAAREAERKELDAAQAGFRARHKAIDGSAAIDGSEVDTDDTLDDGLNPDERSLKQELKEEKEAKAAPDPLLHETAHILFDAIGLIKADPKLAAEVEPYGGKPDDGAVAAVAGQEPAPAASATH